MHSPVEFLGKKKSKLPFVVLYLIISLCNAARNVFCIRRIYIKVEDTEKINYYLYFSFVLHSSSIFFK